MGEAKLRLIISLRVTGVTNVTDASTPRGLCRGPAVKGGLEIGVTGCTTWRS